MSLPLPKFSNLYEEDIYAAIETLLRANVPAFITKMNADRTDLTLATINDAAYIFQTLNTMVEHNPYVLYGESLVETEARGPGHITIFETDVAVVLKVEGMLGAVAAKRLLRYRKILREIFSAGWQSVSPTVKIEVENISPFPLTLLNSSNPDIGIGVRLRFALA